MRPMTCTRWSNCKLVLHLVLAFDGNIQSAMARYHSQLVGQACGLFGVTASDHTQHSTTESASVNSQVKQICGHIHVGQEYLSHMFDLLCGQGHPVCPCMYSF